MNNDALNFQAEVYSTEIKLSLHQKNGAQHKKRFTAG